jgi:hypothetical protein
MIPEPTVAGVPAGDHVADAESLGLAAEISGTGGPMLSGIANVGGYGMVSGAP